MKPREQWNGKIGRIRYKPGLTAPGLISCLFKFQAGEGNIFFGNYKIKSYSVKSLTTSAPGLNARYGFNKFAGIVRNRPVIHIFTLPDLFDPPLIHYHNPITDIPHTSQVVG